jgi:hypothetical protein
VTGWIDFGASCPGCISSSLRLCSMALPVMRSTIGCSSLENYGRNCSRSGWNADAEPLAIPLMNPCDHNCRCTRIDEELFFS